MPFPRATEIAHLLVKQRLHAGDHAVDATVGNGHDTAFLAECVGRLGKVDGFDIQLSALESARTLLEDNPQVRLHHLGHEFMDRVVTPGVGAIMFNLGYFPSGDKSLVTRPDTTLAALSISLSLLSEKGLLSVVVYTGHEGGPEEGAAVERWIDSLNQDTYRIVHYGSPLRHSSPPAPYLIAVERRARN